MSGYKKNSLNRRERETTAFCWTRFFPIISHLPQSAFYLFFVLPLFPLIKWGRKFRDNAGNAWEHPDNRGWVGGKVAGGFENLKYYISCLTDIFLFLLTAGFVFFLCFASCFDCCTCVIKLFYFGALSVCQLLLICCVSKGLPPYFRDDFQPKICSARAGYD